MKNKWEQISGKWKQFGPEARKKWDELTEDEVTRAGGNRSVLSSFLQKRYRIAKKRSR